MDNVQKCDGYINVPSLQTYLQYRPSLSINKILGSLRLAMLVYYISRNSEIRSGCKLT
jgi:hypothetical protein